MKRTLMVLAAGVGMVLTSCNDDGVLCSTKQSKAYSEFTSSVSHGYWKQKLDGCGTNINCITAVGEQMEAERLRIERMCN